MSLKKITVLISGGASGMGEATSRHLAQLGAQVLILDKNPNAQHIAQSLGGSAWSCDITEAAALENVFEQIPKTLESPLRAVINCAGIAPAQRMVNKAGPVSLDWFSDIVKVNLIGTFNVMRLAAPLMVKNDPIEGERGVIINTASIAAFEGQIGQTAYSASKAGVIGLMLPAARELASFGIRVMTIAPGLIDTPLLQNLPETVKTSLQAQSLFPKRFGYPQEYAALVAHIIQNSFLNAEVIRLDGGLRMTEK